MPANIDQFNEYVALYLSKLYRKFPTPDYITVKDVGVSLDGIGFGMDDDGNNDFEAAAAAAHWLLDEGYVRGTRHQAGVMLCVLTSRAFDILQRPSSLDRQKKWGEVVIDLTKGAAKEARSAGIGALIGALRQAF